MSSKAHSFVIVILFISSVLLGLAGKTLAGRYISRGGENVDKKEPEWFHKNDRSFLIPGIGRVMVPPMHHSHSRLPSIPIRGGNIGFGGITRAPPSRHIPGADDTSLPNPGYEVPSPVTGAVPVPASP